MKKPRSWAEALNHPGIESIEDERDAAERDPDTGEWFRPPFFIYLSPGWNWDGLTAFAIYGFRELQQEWDHIENKPGDDE